MTIYVDDMKAAFGRMKMCHMIADTDDELHAMADRIGELVRELEKAEAHGGVIGLPIGGKSKSEAIADAGLLMEFEAIRWVLEGGIVTDWEPATLDDVKNHVREFTLWALGS
jgi:hypothetical protein